MGFSERLESESTNTVAPLRVIIRLSGIQHLSAVVSENKIFGKKNRGIAGQRLLMARPRGFSLTSGNSTVRIAIEMNVTRHPETRDMPRG